MMKRIFSTLAVAGCLALPAVAQNVVSARAGLVNYVEGSVFIEDREVNLSPRHTYESMKDNEVVRTREGRAEVLLTPGIVLRMAEHSAVRLVSGSLTAPIVEIMEGDAIVEAAELYDADNGGARVRVRVGEREALLAKTGIYRFLTDPAAVRVYEGRVELATDNPEKPIAAKKGTVLAMSGEPKVAKFDTDQTDTLYRWASRRSGYIALANISAAKMVRDGSYNSSFYGSGMRSGWFYNPYFGMFTYIPFNGGLVSPFGYRYYSPRTVSVVYNPPPAFNGGGGGPSMGGFDRNPTYNSSYGYNTVGARSVGGMSGGSMGGGSGPSAAPAAASDGGSRGGGAGASRGSSGAGGRGR